MANNRPMEFSEVSPGSFIYQIKDALDPIACGQWIERFESRPDEQVTGRLGQKMSSEQSIKKTVDIRVSGVPGWQDVDRTLFQSVSDALGLISQLHPFFAVNAFKDTGYHLQRYLAGEYYHWHVDGGPGAFSQRQLVALWYLNDVTGPGGETEFAFQDLKVTPVAGTLLLFPPFWTHVHRSVTLAAGKKYIATTWISFS